MQLDLELSWIQLLLMYLAIVYPLSIIPVRRNARDIKQRNKYNANYSDNENFALGTFFILVSPIWMPFWILCKACRLLFVGI